MLKYFNECPTIELVKQKYRELALIFHPDRGGNLEDMQALNAEYHSVLKSFHGTKTYTTDNKEYEYKYNENLEQVIIDMISKVLSEKLGDDVDLLLIGTWLWIVGNTKPVKDKLKELGFKWHSKKNCWFFHSGEWRGKGSNTSLGDIASKYGYRKYASKLQTKLAEG
jgi:hypothetical protein